MIFSKSGLTTSLFLMLILTILSCKKNVDGCTDSAADNYNTEANTDDGTCNFHGNLNAWYDNTTRDSLLANNVASVTVYIDGEVFTNIYPASVLWSAEPECSTSSIGNWLTMQGVKSKSFSLLVKALDSSNAEIKQWSETLNITSGTCQLYKIIW